MKNNNLLSAGKSKQKTLEEIAEEYSEKYFNRYEILMRHSKISFIDGFKLAQNQIYNNLEDKKLHKEEVPTNLESVLAKITHQNDLGLSQWHEVVYYDNDDDKWCCYSGSKTFENGERVVGWKYCKDLI